MSNNLIADLEEFTREMAKHSPNQVVRTVPTVPSEEIYQLRGSLIHEEVQETFLAMDDLQIAVEQLAIGQHPEKSMPELFEKIADGIADSIVVLIGTALAYGIPLQKVWDEVHRSNMDKVTKLCYACEGGTIIRGRTCLQCWGSGRIPIIPRKREDGKILKPEGWVGPDIKSIIEEAMK